MTTETGPGGYRVDVQGLRALAVILVILFHADLPVSGGFVGVDVFFVISGFVITQRLVAALASERGLSLPGFYLGRAKRLLPPLALMSTVTAVAAMILSPIGSQQISAQTGVSASLFVANLFLYRNSPGYFSPGAEFNAMLHTWSLSVEEQFYFVFPLLLLLTWSWGLKRSLVSTGSPEARRLPEKYLAWVIGGVLLGSFSLSCLLSYGAWPFVGPSAPQRFAFYASPTRAWEFALGAMLALPAWSVHRLSKRQAVVWGFVGLALVLASAFSQSHATVFPGFAALLPVGGTALLIYAGSQPESPLRRALTAPLAVWVGDRSYGWYLWHWPLVVLARASFPGSVMALVVASAIALVLAAWSYRYMELPLRKRSSMGTGQVLGLALACLLIPIAAFLALAKVQDALAPEAVSKALALHADARRGCEAVATLRNPDHSPCVWSGDGNKGTIWLVGDSNAGHITEVVAAAGNQAGYKVVVATAPACPFVDLQMVRQGLTDQQCLNFVHTALQALEAHPPSLVIVASASDGYIEESSSAFRAATDAGVQTDVAAKARLWQQGLDLALERLTRGSPVLVVHPVPRFRTWTLGACPAYKAWMTPQACGESVPREGAERWRARAVESESAAVAKHQRSQAIDLLDLYCGDAECTTHRDGVFLFRDGAHLSVEGAMLARARLTEAMKALLK